MIYQLTWKSQRIAVGSLLPPKPEMGDYDLGQDIEHIVYGPRVPPATARVNCEGRNITLRYYKSITREPFYSPHHGNPVTYFNPALDIVFFGWLPVLSTLPQPPPESTQPLLDILALVEHIGVETGNTDLFKQLAADLEKNTPAVRNMCPALQTVDHAVQDLGGWARLRLCQDTSCTETTHRTLSENGPWGEHKLRGGYFVGITGRAMMTYRPCREMPAEMMEATPFVEPDTDFKKGQLEQLEAGEN
jgi:hypothetical protein